MRLRRRDERAVVRLDRLVRDDARQDQLPAAAGAPVVRLRLPDRQLDVAARDLLVQPHGRAARGDADVLVHLRVAGLVLEELDPHSLHPREVLAPDLLLDVRLGHREDLAVRADDDRLDPRGLDGVEDGREQLRLRGRPELIVDHDREARLPGEQLREARAGDRRLERLAGRLRRVRDRLRLVRVDRREDVRVRDLELELVAVQLAVVAGRADRERVERFVRDPICRHATSSVARLQRPTERGYSLRALRSTAPNAMGEPQKSCG